jgi:ABC-type multidrug transport system fused ATPase/permease subunit
LRENVAFGVPPEEIDEQALERAILAARLDDFVASLPAGLSTVVGERGVRLSGGQRQRIGIARALYHDPAVLVLDEATSALDTATESEVMAAVNALQGAKTLVIIAHRLSTVEQCDVVYRLESGRVVGSGTLAEVVQR